MGVREFQGEGNNIVLSGEGMEVWLFTLSNITIIITIVTITTIIIISRQIPAF